MRAVKRLFLFFGIILVLIYSTSNAQTVADNFQFPLPEWDYYTCNSFGFGQFNPNFGSYHLGQDTNVSRTAVGTPVFAVADGVVVISDNKSFNGYGSDDEHQSKKCGVSHKGYVVVIEHQLPDGSFVTSLYGHLQQGSNAYDENQQTGLIPLGSEVKKGQYIGKVANYWHFTGKRCQKENWQHLHFGIRNGKYASRHDWLYVRGYDDAEINWDKDHTVHRIWEEPNDFVNCHQDVAIYPSWEFDMAGNLECWKPYNIERYSIDNDIFYIDPKHGDPYIVSPLLWINSQDYTQLEVCLASNARDGIGAVYFTTTTEPLFSEDKKVPFAVNNDGSYNTYTIEMSEHPKWIHTITHIRIDPANRGIENSDTDTIGFDFISLKSAGPTEEKLIASDGEHNDQFGKSVSISGDYAIVGADGDNDHTGSAYIFQRTGSSWTEVSKIKASDGAPSDRFGWSVAISGDYAIVGADSDDDNGIYSGSAYIFQRTGSSWSQLQKLTASDGAAYDYFGKSVSISGDYAIVGAAGDDDNGPYSNSGSAYIFQRTGSSWSQLQKLTASDGAAYDYFGECVAISGNYAIAGAHCDDDNGINSGSAYIFQRTGSSWSQLQKLTASDGASGDEFGRFAFISGDYAIVGAFRDDDNGMNSGSAYVYTIPSYTP
jgi:murein DD-endopeptidase MepM/ murein hydrolase activator NlpD